MTRARFPFVLAAGFTLATGAPGAEPSPDAQAMHAAAPSPPPDEKELHGLLNLGASLTERLDFDAAAIAFWQVLHTRHAPEDCTRTALLGLARLYRREGSFTKAVAVYERFLKDYPGDERTPDAQLDLGRTLRAMGAHKLALARFYGVINSTLKLPGEGFARYQVLAKTAQFEIAETHYQAGDYAEAHKFFSRLRLLDLAPADRARVSFRAASALHLLGDHEAAVNALRTFLDEWPAGDDAPEARYLLATSLRELHRTAEAFAVTLELLRSEQPHATADPKRWAYWQRRTGNQLANDFFETGDVAHALAIYTSLAALSDEPGWRLPIVYQIGLCRERLGAPDAARDCYHTVIDAITAAPSPDTAELGRMAAWRLGQLDWRAGLQNQVSALFDTTTGQTAAAPDATLAPLPSS